MLKLTNLKTVSIEDADITLVFKGPFTRIESPADYSRDPATMHFHSHYELHFVVKGHMRVFFHNRTVELSAGGLLLLKPGIVHCAVAQEDGTCYGSLQFLLSQRDCPTAVTGLAGQMISAFDAQDFAQFSLSDSQRAALEGITACGTDDASHCRAAFRTADFVFGLYSELSPDASARPNTFFVDCDATKHNIADMFINYYFAPGAPVSELAESLHMSVKQAERTLRRFYGATYNELVLRLRMENAAYLLRTTEQTIIDIADSVGYPSVNHFFTCFKKYYGCTPSKYRKMYKN